MTFLFYSALYLGIGYIVYRLNRDYLDDMLAKDTNVSILLLTQDFMYLGFLVLITNAFVILLWPLFLIGRLFDLIKREIS
jgi:hypothetical protein